MSGLELVDDGGNPSASRFIKGRRDGRREGWQGANYADRIASS